MTPRLAAEGLACVRGGRLLFEGLSLAASPGGAVRVTGENGAGKSSLLRMLAGLLAPAAGTLTVEGRVALLAEQHALDQDVALERALRFWARVDGVSRERVTEALAAVGLARVAEAPVRILSTGQRRRAGLARVLASDAAIWLLDEPTSGLDAASVVMIERLIAAHRAGGGIAVVATHQPLDMPEAAEVRL